VWHELVLHGIGGRTIAEAKERITHDEFVAWHAYIRKRGTLNWGMRLEVGFGFLLSRVYNATGGDTEPADFLPHMRPEPLEDTPENLARLMRGDMT
jgi:hypothetical protein